jgi:hypothetical protein
VALTPSPYQRDRRKPATLRSFPCSDVLGMSPFRLECIGGDLRRLRLGDRRLGAFTAHPRERLHHTIEIVAILARQLPTTRFRIAIQALRCGMPSRLGSKHRNIGYLLPRTTTPPNPPTSSPGFSQRTGM